MVTLINSFDTTFSLKWQTFHLHQYSINIEHVFTTSYLAHHCFKDCLDSIYICTFEVSVFLTLLLLLQMSMTRPFDSRICPDTANNSCSSFTPVASHNFTFKSSTLRRNITSEHDQWLHYYSGNIRDNSSLCLSLTKQIVRNVVIAHWKTIF